MRRKSIVLIGIFVMVAAMMSMPGASLAAPSWHDMGGGLSSSTVRTLAYDGAHDLLYAGTTSGVWRCTSLSENPSWKKISAAANIGSFTIPSVTYDPARNVLYTAANSGTGTTSGKGIWRSKNPNSTPTNVTVTYMTPSGAIPQEPFTMDPNSRKTIRVNDELSATDFSTQVRGTRPIIAERAMYWDNGTGEACHDSIGMNAPLPAQVQKHSGHPLYLL